MNYTIEIEKTMCFWRKPVYQNLTPLKCGDGFAIYWLFWKLVYFKSNKKIAN